MYSRGLMQPTAFAKIHSQLQEIQFCTSKELFHSFCSETYSHHICNPSQDKMATNIRPYKIEVPAADVQRLKQKLSDTRLPEGEEDDLTRGPPVQTIRRIAKHWEEKFDWPAFQSRLNKLPNYEATIALDGFKPFKVHFVHQKSSEVDTVPLLFVHGCKANCSPLPGVPYPPTQ